MMNGRWPVCIDCCNLQFIQIHLPRKLSKDALEILVRYLKPLPDPDVEFRGSYLRVLLLGP